MAGRVYDTKRWLRVRARQLAREPLCRACLALGRTVEALHVDHRQAIEAGGAPYALENLQSLCAEHHSLKTNAVERRGLDLSEWEARGCYSDGSPRDPTHPWFVGPPPGEA